MYSTTALAKNPKFTGRIMGTHQQLDQSARKVLTRYLPKGKYFRLRRTSYILKVRVGQMD